MSMMKQERGKITPLFIGWIVLLLGMIGLGLYAGALVLTKGLAVTNLTNQLPWGLWITIDLSAVALGTGAFTLSTAVYIFGMKRYEAIARAAIFIGFLSYISAMISLLMDIGRPDRFYHPVIYWNPYSVLWGITIGAILYISVLMTEVIPIVIESSTRLSSIKPLNWLAHFLHRIMPLVAILGLGVSVLAQALYGATYGVLTARPVWYSPSAPVMFILSAVAGGVGFTVFITLLTGELRRKQLVPQDIINKVALFAGFTSMAYLYLKLWSWAATNFYSQLPSISADIQLLSENTPYGFTFWWFEVLLGSLIPVILFLYPRTRRNRYALMLAGFLTLVGLVMYRWNMTLSGFVVPLDWSPGVANVFELNHYTPALSEWGVGIGVVGFWLLAWTLAMRYLNLYPLRRDIDEAVEETIDTAEVPAAAR